jgi:hypothetical protein
MHRSERPFGSCIPTGARDSARKKEGAGSSSALASASRQTPSATRDCAVTGPKEPIPVFRSSILRTSWSNRVQGLSPREIGRSAHCRLQNRGTQCGGRLCGRSDARFRFASVVSPRGAHALSCLRGKGGYQAGNHRFVSLPRVRARRRGACSGSGRATERRRSTHGLTWTVA